MQQASTEKRNKLKRCLKKEIWEEILEEIIKQIFFKILPQMYYLNLIMTKHQTNLN